MPDFRTKLDRPLSPAAQAVFDAGDIGFATHREMIGAALRAAADQMSSHHSKSFLYSIADALKLQTIAIELEAQ